MLRPASASVLFVRVSIVFSSPGLELDKSASDAFVSSSVLSRAPPVLRLVSAEALITISRPARCVHCVFLFLRWLLAAVDLHLEQAGTVVVENKL